MSQKVRALVFDSALRDNEVMAPVWGQLQQQERRDATWEWVKKNTPAILKRLPKHHGGVRIIGAAETFCDEIYSGDGPNPPGTSAILTILVYSLFDVDANTQSEAVTDGLLLIRYMFGLTGTALTHGAVGPLAQRSTAAAIESYIAGAGMLLDVDGNLQVDALTDGLIIIRYLFGLRGAALIQSAVGLGASRMTAGQIEAYISGFLP